MPRGSVEERFWLRVRKDPDGCWRWTGALFMGSRYGMLSVNRSPALAHRVSWELLRGPILEGAQIDHLCRVRECVNPEHLEPVSCRTNLLRGETLAAANAAKTECKRGHPFDAENTYPIPGGGRACRTCRREAGRRAEVARRAARVPAAPRTHCVRGHEFTEGNIYVTPDGRRQCRACQRRREQERRRARP